MPYLPNERQYRDFPASNFWPVVRTAADDADADAPLEQSYEVRGHFTTFDTEYELMPGFFESVDSRALDGTDMSDVLFQFNHMGMVLARLRNGSLEVGVDSEGGWAHADLSGCQEARNLYEAIQNGLIDRMSFGFTIDDDGFEWDEDEDGNIHSRITKISKIFDVSAVDLPANESTDISARSYVDAAIEARTKLEEEQRKVAEAEEAERRAAEDAARMRRVRRARALALKSL